MQKLSRPGAGRQPSCMEQGELEWARLRHAEPAAQLSVRYVGQTRLSKLLPEREDLEQLRFRWYRMIEVRVAYDVFLNREVHIGPGKVCPDGAIVAQTTHTLLIVYYSYLYSLFDPSGTNFSHVVKAIEPDLPQSAFDVVAKINSLWSEVREPLTRIRHNMGFHGSRAQAGQDDAIKQLHRMHPLLPQALVAYLRVFFHQLGSIFEGQRSLNPASQSQIEFLLEMARATESEARKPEHEIPDPVLTRLGITRAAYNEIQRAIRDAEEPPN